MSIAPPAAAATARAVPMRPRGVLNPYVQLAFGAVTVTSSELLLKVGATSAHATGLLATLGVGALASPWTWAGILCYLVSFASWVYVLRHVPLGIAYAIISVAQVLIPLGCWIFLGEAISFRRWVGVALVLGGISLLLRQVVRAEQKLS